MARYALIDADGVVRNIIEWDEVSPYAPPAGFSLVVTADNIGPARLPGPERLAEDDLTNDQGRGNGAAGETAAGG